MMRVHGALKLHMWLHDVRSDTVLKKLKRNFYFWDVNMGMLSKFLVFLD